MLWITLTLLGFAIALWCIGHYQADEIVRFLGFSLSLAFLMGALVAAPWVLKCALFLALIFYPSCTPEERSLKPACPRLCPLRRQCQSAR
ncbi:MAG: hypothetical protein AAF289_05060 [Cyanobacteria bacterium P01_A01_bin.135]